MKTVILGICFLLVSQISSAQTDKKGKKTPEQRAEMMTNALNKEVTLTQEQKDKVYAINLRTAQKNQEIRKQTDLTEEQKKEKLKSNNQNRRKQVMAELTEDQKKVLKEKKKAKKNANLDEDDDM